MVVVVVVVVVVDLDVARVVAKLAAAELVPVVRVVRGHVGVGVVDDDVGAAGCGRRCTIGLFFKTF